MTPEREITIPVTLDEKTFNTILSIKDYQIWDGFFALAKLNGGRRSSATLTRHPKMIRF